MEKDDNRGMENILNSPKGNSGQGNVNERIKGIPDLRAAISEAIAVTYGPPPILNEDIYDINSQKIDEEPIVIMDSDINGGPLSEYLLVEETDISDLVIDIELMCDDNINLEDRSINRNSNELDDIIDCCV